jgi:hypothetical protein
MLTRPENVVRAEAFLGTFLGTKEGMADLSEMAYGAGDLRTAKKLEGKPLEDGWVTDAKCIGSINMKLWHLPLLAAGGYGIYVGLKKAGAIDALAEFFGID